METCERLLHQAVAASAEASTPALLHWLQGCSQTLDDSEFPCSRSEFSLYFVNYIRNKTERFFKLDEDNDSSKSAPQIEIISNTHNLSTKDNVNNSPTNNALINCNKLDKEKINKTEFGIQNAIYDEKTILSNTSIDGTNAFNAHSKIEHSSFNESFDASSNAGFQAKSEGSDTSLETNNPSEYFATPKRNASFGRGFLFSPVTPVNNSDPRSFDNTFTRFSTPNTNRSSCETTPNHKFNTLNKNQSRERTNVQQGHRKSTNQRNICIGDFMMTNKGNVNENASSRKKKNRFLNLSLDDPLINANKENTRLQNDLKNASNLNIDDKYMFPDIGSHKGQNHDAKADSHSQMRRIKPTRLNMTFPSEEQPNTNLNVPLNMKFGIKYDKVEQNEAFKMQNCQIREHSTGFTNERDMLRKEKVNLIEKFNQISNITPKKILTPSSPVNLIALKRKIHKSSVLLIFELKKVDSREILDLFIKIFTTIIDSNLIPNVISELYYLISIAMIQHSQIHKSVDGDAVEIKDRLHSNEVKKLGNIEQLLDNVQNCIYFALGCLEKQRQLLNMVLDRHCLRLILQSDRIKIFSTDFADFLSLMHTQKTTVEEKVLENSSPEGLLNRNVCFITDTDSADNFPSHQNFITFKSQRDGFYEILRMWEANHLSPGWMFDVKLGPKVRSLVSMGASPSNLAHLARLFKSQLLVACNVQEKSESLAQLQSVIGGSGVSQNKLSKLTERLTSALPGQLQKKNENILNTPPEFSGCEEFFRDFIIHSSNSNFREHLIDSIVEEIYKLDESGFLPSENEDSAASVDKEAKAQYVICIKSLRVLAKFLGFLMSLPYRLSEKSHHTSIPGVNRLGETIPKNDNVENSKVIFSEIAVRNQTLPPINLIMIVDSSCRRHRLILTIPWIVQLLAMLDYCYLRLLYFRQLHEMLFEIYGSDICKPTIGLIQLTNSNVDDKYSRNIDTIPYSNKSLIRICLSWLFDLEHFPRDSFFNWLKYTSLKVDDKQRGLIPNQNLTRLLANVTNQPVVGNNTIKIDEHQHNDDENTERLNSENLNDDDIKRFYNLSLEAKEEELELKLDSLEIIDDGAVKEICPFLKDFRLLFLKNQACTNDRDKARNIRHITPVTSSFNVEKPKRKDMELQMRLEEWFLRSQAGTTRRTLEIVSERTGSALVRLAKTQISAYCDRAYAAAQSLVSDSINEESASKITDIYNRQLLEFHLGCKKAGQHVGSKRVHGALQGLLPPGTSPSVMEMCIQICTRNAVRKLVHCLESQYNNIQILFNNNNQLKKMSLTVDHDYFTEQRIIMMHQHNKDNSKVSQNDSSIQLVGSKNDKTFEDAYHSPTLLIIGLKETILNILNGTENINEIGAKILSLLKKINDCSTYPHVDKFSKGILLQLSIDLIICLICFNPSVLNEKYLSSAGIAWKSCCVSNENSTNKKSDISESEVAAFGKFMVDTNTSVDSCKPITIQQKATTASRKVSASDNIESNSNCDSREENTSVIESALKDEVFDTASDGSLNYFNTILCSRNLMLLRGCWSSASDESKWKALETLLVFLLKNNFLTEESLTEQCVAIYRQDWPQDFLDYVAKCIKNLVEKCQLHSNEKLLMMLEFVSEFCQNLDDDYYM
ncbi:codanin-1 like protein dlt [Arctopsyche grandis]|uniref:codanin-1 like protein dlt n=1 Tax=Arctopsyche grandis TaxID=121162 RepID=UPI00406DA481